MPTHETPNAPTSWIATGKDLVALMRDAFILVLLVLLFVFPKPVNTALNELRIVEADLGPFKWKRDIVESTEKTKAAGESVQRLQQDFATLMESLAKLERRVADPNIRGELRQLSSDVQSGQEEAQRAERVLKANLGVQQQLTEKAGISAAPNSGWIYLGRVNQAKSAWAKGNPTTIERSSVPVPVGTRIRIKDDVYLREDSGLTSILGVVRVGTPVEVKDVRYSEDKIQGGWFVWAKVHI